MSGDTKLDEWKLLKHQFIALVHEESADADNIEKIFDEHVRRRFAEFINRAMERDRMKCT